MLLYWITLLPLVDKFREAEPGLLSPFYLNDASFNGSEQRSAHLLRLLMKRGPDQKYLPGVQVPLHLGYTGARGGGEEGILNTGACVELC